MNEQLSTPPAGTPIIQLLMVVSNSVDDLRGIEEKIIRKYRDLTHGSQSPIDPITQSSTYSGTNDPSVKTTETRGNATDSSEDCKISICSDCGGVGKKYETIDVGQPGGVRRVIESCCTVCQGQGYISPGDNGEVSRSISPDFSFPFPLILFFGSRIFPIDQSNGNHGPNLVNISKPMFALSLPSADTIHPLTVLLKAQTFLK